MSRGYLHNADMKGKLLFLRGLASLQGGLPSGVPLYNNINCKLCNGGNLNTGALAKRNKKLLTPEPEKVVQITELPNGL